MKILPGSNKPPFTPVLVQVFYFFFSGWALPKAAAAEAAGLTCWGGRWAAWTGTPPRRCCPLAGGAGRCSARRQCRLSERTPGDTETPQLHSNTPQTSKGLKTKQVTPNEQLDKLQFNRNFLWGRAEVSGLWRCPLTAASLSAFNTNMTWICNFTQLMLLNTRF